MSFTDFTDMEEIKTAEKIAKYTNEFKNIIDKIGLERFTEMFVEEHKNLPYVIDPHEFIEPEDEFFSIYSEEKKAFDLEFYRRFMPKMDPDRVATTLGSLIGRDFPDEVLNKLTE